MSKLSDKDVKEILESLKKKEVYKMEGHSFVPLKHVGKQYCKRCGLLALNNDLSRWAINMGCNYRNHPQFQATIHKYTKPKWSDL